MYRAKKVILLLNVIVFIACTQNTINTEHVSPELIEFPIPFYELSPGCSAATYYGIKTRRFCYVENKNGPWLLFDKYVDTNSPINLIGLDEYTYIQLDLARQRKELLQRNTNNFFPGKTTFYDLIPRNEQEKTKVLVMK